jgi:hypothetical protein
MVSKEGGMKPSWSPDARRLFFFLGRTIYVVDINPDDRGGFAARKAFDLPPRLLNSQWQLAPDRKRLLFLAPEEELTDGAASSGAALNTLRVVFNWFTELDEKVPVR